MSVAYFTRWLTLLGLSMAVAMSATLTPAALEEWDHAVQQSKAELSAGACDPDHFFLTNAPDARRKVRQGSIVVGRSVHGGMSSVPAGLIHHWVGDVLIPDRRAADLLTALHDYDHYADVYPAIVASQPLGRSGDAYNYRLKFAYHGFGVQTGLLADFRSNYVALAPSNGYTITEATRLVELAKAGKPEERELSFAESRGYLERMFTIVRYREQPEGVYVEVEALSLSRDIPSSVRWLVTPLVERFSRQVLSNTLASLRGQMEDASFTATKSSRALNGR